MIEVSYENIPEDNSYEYIINRVVKEVLKEENIVHDVSVDVILTDNDGIHKINKEHRDVDSATDVLSFPMYEKDEISKLKEPKEDDVEEILGDIVVSIPKAKEQAEEYGHSFERELAYLVCHGMHHLLGYDHIEEEDKKVMREHEERVLTNLQLFRVGEGESLSVADREPKKENDNNESVTEEIKEDEKKEAEENDNEAVGIAAASAATIEAMSKELNDKIDSIINENIASGATSITKEAPKYEKPKTETPNYNINSKNSKQKSDASPFITIIAFLIVLIIAMALVYFFLIKPSEQTGIFSSGDYSGDVSGEDSGEIIEEIEEEYFGPKIFSGDSRSVAVMIDNDTSAAWPHAGLNNAYMVYEITVEGSATRLMAVFKKDNLPDLVGPIRSCRHYFLDYVQEHDAIYCHFGQSTQGGEALRDRNISNINGIVDNYYKRITDVDKTWHNAFSTKELIDKYIAKKGYRDTQTKDCILTYNQKDTDLDHGDSALDIECRFSGIQTTSFKYDEEAKNYQITMKNGKTEKPHIEKYTNDPFVAKNILIYQVGNDSVWNAWGDYREEDNKKRRVIYNTGSGTGYFITNGKVIKMKWSKPDHSSKTTYKDMFDNELTFNDGTTWVEIMPLDGKITITGNQESSGEKFSGEKVTTTTKTNN